MTKTVASRRSARVAAEIFNTLPGPRASLLPMKGFELTAEDGLPIHVDAWLPEGEPAAVVQIVHGMSEYAARYAPLAEALCAAGIAVYGNDHRGHGKSLAPGQTLGHMADSRSFDRGVRDVAHLNEQVRQKHPNKRVAVFGHSMGSFYVQRLLYTRPDIFDAAVLSATSGAPPPIAAAGRLVARAERLRVGKDRPSALLQAVSFGDFNKKFAPNRTDFDWLSRDPAMVDAYVADPFCGFPVSTQTWIDLLDAAPSLTEPGNVGIIPKDLPIYIFAGTRDAVGEMGKGVDKLVRSYRAAGLNIDLRMYEDGRHEMLNETNRDRVISDCVTWISGAIAT